MVSQASQAREIEILDCKFAAPLGFCRGCGPRFRVHLSHHACSLCGFFRCFGLFGVLFEANWFLTLIAFDKKDNAVPTQPGVRVFGRAKTNYIIAKHMYTRRFLHDRSVLEVFILDRAWPVWSGCEMTCFCYIVGTTLFILFTNTTLNRLGFGMLNRTRGNSHISLAIVDFNIIYSCSGHKLIVKTVSAEGRN